MLTTPAGAVRLSRLNRRAVLSAAVVAVGWGGGAYGSVPPPPIRQNTWIGPTDPLGSSWTNPLFWSFDGDGDPLTPPTNELPSSTNNHWTVINNDGWAKVEAGDNAEASFLTLGVTYRAPGDVDKGNLLVTGGTLSVGELRVGGRESLHHLTGIDPDPNDGGIGYVKQTGGTVNVTYTHGADPTSGVNYEPPVQSMYVGDSANDAKPTPGPNHAEGTYHITAGTLNVGLFRNDQLVVGTGVATKGTFIQEGGDVTSKGTLLVARRGAVATYTMSGGSLTVHGFPGMAIGDGEAAGINTTHGTFTQSGGTVNVRSDLRVGRRNGTGVYDMSGGTLNLATTDSIYTGADIVTAGSLNIGSLGEGTTASLMNSVGTFKLRGDAVVNIGQLSDGATFVSNLNVGLGNTTTPGSPTGNRGFLEMSGGEINMRRPGAVIAVGNGAGVVGTADITGGTINNTAGGATSTSMLDVGRNMSSGTLKLSGTGTINTAQLVLNSGNHLGTTRTAEINGGTLNAGLVTFTATNSASTRTFKVTNGNVTIGDLISGAVNAGGSALTDISGGTVSIAKMTLGGGSVIRLANINLSIPGVTQVTSQTNFGNFEIAAGSTLTLAGGVTTPATTARNFRTQNLSGTLTIAGPQSYGAGGTTLHHNAGTLNMDSNANGNLTINANSTANFNASQRLNALNVGPNATSTVASGGDKTLHVNTLAISATGGKLQMTDNDLLVEYTTSPEAQIRQWVKDGRVSGATSGIFATPGSPDDDKVVAVADNAAWGKSSFNGINIPTNTVVGKYTYFGDANLDGKVTGDDYVAVDANLGTGDTWLEGDFNMNGVTTGDDYVAIDANLGKGTPTPLAYAELKEEMVAAHVAMFGEEYLVLLAKAEAEGFGASVVPEPAAVSLLGLGAVGLLARRRRSR